MPVRRSPSGAQKLLVIEIMGGPKDGVTSVDLDRYFGYAWVASLSFQRLRLVLLDPAPALVAKADAAAAVLVLLVRENLPPPPATT
jgi:hypothetical protein